MVRTVIWAQAGCAAAGLVATLVDQGVVPRSLVPPEPLLLLALLSVFVLPVVVILAGRRRPPGTGQAREAFASLALAAVTVFALFPMVQ